MNLTDFNERDANMYFSGTYGVYEGKVWRILEVREDCAIINRTDTAPQHVDLEDIEFPDVTAGSTQVGEFALVWNREPVRSYKKGMLRESLILPDNMGGMSAMPLEDLMTSVIDDSFLSFNEAMAKLLEGELHSAALSRSLYIKPERDYMLLYSSLTGTVLGACDEEGVYATPDNSLVLQPMLEGLNINLGDVA